MRLFSFVSLRYITYQKDLVPKLAVFVLASSMSVYPPLLTVFYFLQVHGEVTDPHVDTFDREKVFIERILAPLVQKLPQLKIVMEHITTMDAVNFVESCKEGLCYYNHLNTSVCPYIWSSQFLCS